jgi:hypothetical protein
MLKKESDKKSSNEKSKKTGCLHVDSSVFSVQTDLKVERQWQKKFGMVLSGLVRLRNAP